jgi:hypothetical protein
MKIMAKVLFDITHPAQFNFYLISIKNLAENYEVLVTILNRGKLPAIAKYELEGLTNVKIVVIGQKKNYKLSSILEANFLRIFQLLLYSWGKDINLGYSNGYQASLVGRILGFPVITFGDDPQALDYRFKLLFADKMYFCLYSNKIANLNNKAHILRCIKEWSYLNTKDYTPDEKVLKQYGLEKKQYFFIREVSTTTLNYYKQKNGLVAGICDKIPKDYKVIFSLENKNFRHLYPDNWIILEEPIEDIYSLIFYSKLLISSGDSMVREAAVLGIPGIYVGKRKMFANSALIELADFYQYTEGDFNSFLNPIISSSSFKRQEKIREKLHSEFIDLNKFIIKISQKLLK